MFITFEGSDGSGKSTQIKKLYEYILMQGHDVMLTSEPGGTDIGEKIREIVLNRSNAISITPETELFLYETDRAQHVRELIMPALKKGTIVICDRYSDSTYAYQHYGRGLSGEMIENLNFFSTNGLVPDITFYLAVDIDVAHKRIFSRAFQPPDRIESEDEEFHARVKEGFDRLCEMYPKRIKRIDANRSIEEIWNDIRREYETCMGDYQR